MKRQHTYEVAIEWTGNTGAGTRSYGGYARTYEIHAAEKPAIPGSSDPSFRGDAARWNPEELLVAALAACHQLWYLHLCATAGIVVESYCDAAHGIMLEEESGAGRFQSVTLRPQVGLAHGADERQAARLHEEAARMCFIARSVAFPVHHEPSFTRAGTAS